EKAIARDPKPPRQGEISPAPAGQFPAATINSNPKFRKILAYFAIQVGLVNSGLGDFFTTLEKERDMAHLGHVDVRGGRQTSADTTGVGNERNIGKGRPFRFE